MERDKKGKRTFSRREFMKGVPIGVAGAFVAGVVYDGLLGTMLKRRRKQPPSFPKGSIFTPAKDHQDRI